MVNACSSPTLQQIPNPMNSVNNKTPPHDRNLLADKEDEIGKYKAGVVGYQFPIPLVQKRVNGADSSKEIVTAYTKQ